MPIVIVENGHVIKPHNEQITAWEYRGLLLHNIALGDEKIFKLYGNTNCMENGEIKPIMTQATIRAGCQTVAVKTLVGFN